MPQKNKAILFLCFRFRVFLPFCFKNVRHETILTISQIETIFSFACLVQRMTIKNKKIFWEDLGLARKIYRNLAYQNDNDDGDPNNSSGGSNNNTNSDRSLGFRHHISYFVSNSFFPASGRSTRPASKSGLDVPGGHDDPAASAAASATTTNIPASLDIHTALATVVEEERLNGYSSA